MTTTLKKITNINSRKLNAVIMHNGILHQLRYRYVQ